MSQAKVMAVMALGVAIGIPLVAYLWETINQVLALRFDLARLAITLPVTVALWLYLRFVGKRIHDLADDVHSSKAGLPNQAKPTNE